MEAPSFPKPASETARDAEDLRKALERANAVEGDLSRALLKVSSSGRRESSLVNRLAEKEKQVDDNAAVGDLITVNASDVVDAYDIQRDWWHSGADAGDSSPSKKSSSCGFFSLGMILSVVAGVIILICVGVGAFVYNAYENAKNLGETTVRRERPRRPAPTLCRGGAALEMAGRPGAAYASGAASSCVGASSSSSPKADVDVDELELRLPTRAQIRGAARRAASPRARSSRPRTRTTTTTTSRASRPTAGRRRPRRARSSRGAGLPDSGWHWIAADGTQTGPADLAALAAAWARKDVGGATLAYNARVGPDWTAVADLDRPRAPEARARRRRARDIAL
ncbi:hypothetical protein JL722_14553 [Aureococcus anophagefferens]|nr:hypothetical protein JL722_14553 [Aureococcus anophagefferens]